MMIVVEGLVKTYVMGNVSACTAALLAPSKKRFVGVMARQAGK